MTDYNDGRWHGWNGAPCPVHLHSQIELIWMHEDGEVDRRSAVAGNAAFEGNHCGKLIAFRVVKEYREPREWWICPTEGAVLSRVPGIAGGHFIHVREVMEDR